MKEAPYFKSYEAIPTEIYSDANSAVLTIARDIRSLIEERAASGKPVVLGLATGSTPVPLYRELIRYHKEEGLSFANVITFNLDEYFGLQPDHPESYNRFMREQLFDHIDVPDDQIHIPDGTCTREEVFEKCAAYESAIKQAGGIDMQILGIGRTGHIGFNEPGSSLNSLTRLVALDSLTRSDAARDFLGEQNVPRYAITMGVGTILSARRIYLMAWGKSKAEILRRAIEEPPTDSVPSSYLQDHDDVHVVIDESAAVELTRYKYPWLVTFPEWTDALTRKAVTDLSLKIDKPLLKLVDKDYRENGLSELEVERGPAYALNIRIFNEVQHTITGWPGGKPNTDDADRPERAEPALKRVLILSPEPQEDVLAMGGTITRLANQGHDITVAYMTSGSLAVPDSEAQWALQLMRETGQDNGDSFITQARQDLDSKSTNDLDTPSLRRLKAYIRRNEARAAMTICSEKITNIEFLDLPFYEKGQYRRFKTSDEDVATVLNLLRTVKPHQVYITGNQAEPSTVEGLAYTVFEQALGQVENEAWAKNCWVWLYLTGNKEWDIHQIDMAVPCSPDELQKKTHAIYQHRSQRSQSPVSEANYQETWEQAEARNRRTAALYDRLGMAEYEAIECFVKLTH